MQLDFRVFLASCIRCFYISGHTKSFFSGRLNSCGGAAQACPSIVQQSPLETVSISGCATRISYSNVRESGSFVVLLSFVLTLLWAGGCWMSCICLRCVVLWLVTTETTYLSPTSMPTLLIQVRTDCSGVKNTEYYHYNVRERGRRRESKWTE